MSKIWSEKKASRQFVRELIKFASRANLDEMFENNYERREKKRTKLLNAMPFPTSNNDQLENKDRYELLQLSMNDFLSGMCRPYIYIFSKHSFVFNCFLLALYPLLLFGMNENDTKF